MKQPKKTKKSDLKKQLDAVRGAPEPDVSFMVTLPADVYWAMEEFADIPAPEWVVRMVKNEFEPILLANKILPDFDEKK